jgi:hypothetical protein
VHTVNSNPLTQPGAKIGATEDEEHEPPTEINKRREEVCEKWPPASGNILMNRREDPFLRNSSEIRHIFISSKFFYLVLL